MQPRIELVKGAVAAVGERWAVFGGSEEEARRLYAEAVERHEAIRARPDPAPYPSERQQPSWRSPGGVQV